MHRGDGGYFLVFIALGIAIFIGMLSMAINIGYSRSLRTEMQDAVDSAAHAAASILCSTTACYEDAVGLAVAMLTEKGAEGIIKGNSDMVDGDQEFTWTNGVATITIHRGRWWPNHPEVNLPYDGPTAFFHDNGVFEDFDRKVYSDSAGEDITWQQRYPQLPDFLVSNAIYVKAEVNYKNSFFNIFNISDSTLITEAYAVAGNSEKEVCIAPFAIPVCALLNNEGKYDKDNSCLYERHFTESNRYCEKNADGDLEECNTVPGSIYRAYPKATNEADGIEEHIQFLLDEDSDVNFSRTVNSDPGCIFFCSQTTTFYEPHVNFTCDFKSSPQPTLESPSDFFGLVGMPLKSHETLVKDYYHHDKEYSYAEMLDDLASTENFCLGARIGDDFKVLKNGLTTSESADAFKQVLLSNYTITTQFENEYEAIYHSILPKDASLLSTTHTGVADLGALHTQLGCGENIKRQGMCNSQLFYYDTKCLVNQNMYSIDSNSTNYFRKPLYNENMIACPRVEEVGGYTASNLSGQRIYNPENFLSTSDSAKTWTTAIPIVAPKGEGDLGAACAGILSKPAPDPLFAEDTEYTIVGFTTVNFFDFDVGMPPANRAHTPSASAEPTLIAAYQSMSDTWDTFWPSDQPWGFSDTIIPDTGSESPPYQTSCHMVKGMQSCDQGLISAPENATTENRNVKIASPPIP